MKHELLFLLEKLSILILIHHYFFLSCIPVWYFLCIKVTFSYNVTFYLPSIIIFSGKFWFYNTIFYNNMYFIRIFMFVSVFLDTKKKIIWRVGDNFIFFFINIWFFSTSFFLVHSTSEFTSELEQIKSKTARVLLERWILTLIWQMWHSTKLVDMRGLCKVFQYYVRRLRCFSRKNQLIFVLKWKYVKVRYWKKIQFLCNDFRFYTFLYAS